MKREPPFRLIHQPISHDTIECLQELLAHARSGRLIGLSFAGMFKQRGYFCDTAGEAHRNPTFARGTVASLDDHLRERVRKQSH